MKVCLAGATAAVALALVGCQVGRAASDPADPLPQPAFTVAGEPAVLGSWIGEHVTAESAPEPVAVPATAPATDTGTDAEEAPDAEPIPDGWHCNGPAYQCRGAEAEREREEAYWDWVEEENGYDSDDGYWFEDTNDTSCEGAGAYGDYSPEGYEDC